MALGLLLVGSVRIHLVAKEPSATGRSKTGCGKTAGRRGSGRKSRRKQPADKAAEKPKRTLADLSEFPDEPAAHAMFNQLIETLQKAESLSYRCRATQS